MKERVEKLENQMDELFEMSIEDRIDKVQQMAENVNLRELEHFHSLEVLTREALENIEKAKDSISVAEIKRKQD